MELIIDVGNTRAKMALFQAGRPIRVERVADLDDKQLRAFLAGQRPSRIGVASVGADIHGWGAWLSSLAPVTIIDQRSPMPIDSAYNTPLTLGIDRAANAVAAHRRFPRRPVLAIDAGSCITYDLVDADGVFRGGAISPGLRMRARSMHAYSARLPMVDLAGPAPLVAGSTEEALRAGILHGTLGEMRAMIEGCAHVTPDLAVVLTGGDGLWAARALKSGIFAVPLLTLEGLHAILLHSPPPPDGVHPDDGPGAAG
ncbi:MAG: type III pantothenate kinase [Flavobacteriales bacterium]